MFSSKYSNVLRRGWLMMILLIGSLSAALAQDSAGLRVIGNVTDEKGEPLVAATVYAKNNKSVNAITDLDGNYSIVVPDKWTVLVFDFVGYVTKEETVGERKVINVELVEDIGQLDDAVVVAYGTQKKESVVASITSIEPSALKVSTSRSLTNNLAGNVAGVLAIQRPESLAMTILLSGFAVFPLSRELAETRSCLSMESREASIRLMRKK